MATTNLDTNTINLPLVWLQTNFLSTHLPHYPGCLRIFLSMATHSYIVQELGACREQAGWAREHGGFHDRFTSAVASCSHLAAAVVVRPQVSRLVIDVRGGDLVKPGLRQGCTDSKINTHFTCSLPYPPWAAVTKYPGTRQREFIFSLFRRQASGEGHHCWFPASLFLHCKGAAFMPYTHGFPSVHSGKGWGGRDLMSPPSL